MQDTAQVEEMARTSKYTVVVGMYAYGYVHMDALGILWLMDVSYPCIPTP